MKSRVVFGVGLGLLALMSVGCGSPEAKFHGDWDTTVSLGAFEAKGTSNFSPDGKMTMNLKISTPAGSATITDSGTWSLVDGKNLKVDLTSQNWSLEGVAAAMQVMAKGLIDKQKEDVKKGMGDPKGMTVTWTDDKNFSLVSGAVNAVMVKK